MKLKSLQLLPIIYTQYFSNSDKQTQHIFSENYKYVYFLLLKIISLLEKNIFAFFMVIPNLKVFL